MLKIILLTVAFCASALHANADIAIGGTIVDGPARIKVSLPDGSNKFYKTPAWMKAGVFSYEMQGANVVRFGWGHTSSSIFDTNCPRNLGQLAESLTVTIQTSDSSKKQFTIAKATAVTDFDTWKSTPGIVRIAADCKTSPDELSGIQMFITPESVDLE